jgi:hypothetical protein
LLNFSVNKVALIAVKGKRYPHQIAEEIGAPGRIRTSGPQIRSLVLYPAELRVRDRRRHIGVRIGLGNPLFASDKIASAKRERHFLGFRHRFPGLSSV